MTNEATDSTTVAGCPAYPTARDRCPLDPPAELVRIQQETPITRVALWDGSTPWLFTRYDDVRAILSDARISADTFHPNFPHMSAGMKARQLRGKTFINTDGPEHAEQRRKLTADFMVKKVEGLRPKVQQIVDGLIDDMLAGPKPVDLVEALALPVPSLVICELLGVPYTDRELFQRLAATINSQSVPPEEAAQAITDLLTYLEDLIEQKAANPADDLLSRLAVQEYKAGHMTRDEVAKIARLLLVAGHDTTANMIALGTVALLSNPGELELLQNTDDPKVIAGAVDELLRYLTVVHIGRRRVAADSFEFGGEEIRQGDGVIAAAEIANRDPDVFPDPDRLDITRNASGHIAFGFGPHQCLGQSLARLELQVVYGTLYKRIPTLALTEPMEKLDFKGEMAVYGVHELSVTWSD
ncbi:cytochrome P450 [Nocardia sp. NPDC052278]|uniref:cytochrome P450 n=1 Tax=unclassified Nocardia TaxID=2637762 RepID=UPI0036A22CE6